MAEPLAEYLVMLSVEGKEALDAAFTGVKNGMEALDAPVRQFRDLTKGAFAAARQGAIEAATAPRALLAVQAELSRTMTNLTARYQAGSISAAEFGIQSQKAMEQATTRATAAGAAIGKMEVAAKKAAEQQRILSGAFAMTGGALMGYIRAGMAGTTQGEMLAVQFQRLHREIANLFEPAISAVVDSITRLADWFRNLSGYQQEQIARWAGVVAGMMGAVVILPRIAAGFTLIGNAMKVMTVSNPLLMVVGAIAGIALAGDDVSETFGALFEVFKSVGEIISAIFEPFADLLKDIAAALADVLGPALRFIAGLFQKVADFIKMIFGTGRTVTFNTQQGGRQLSELGRDEREEEVRRRRESIADVRRMALSELEEFSQRTGAGQGSGMFRSYRYGTETHREAIMADMERSLQNQQAAASRSRRQLEERGGGFEDVTETFRRLQTAANRTDYAQRTREEQLGEQRRTNDLLQGVASGIARGMPAVGQ